MLTPNKIKRGYEMTILIALTAAALGCTGPAANGPSSAPDGIAFKRKRKDHGENDENNSSYGHPVIIGHSRILSTGHQARSAVTIFTRPLRKKFWP